MKKTLVGIITASIIGLSSCGDYTPYVVLRKDLDKITKDLTELVLKNNDKFLDVYRLMVEGKNKEAQDSLYNYFRTEIKTALELKGEVNAVGILSTESKKEIKDRLNFWIVRTQNYLDSISSTKN